MEQVNRGEEINKWGIHRERQRSGGVEDGDGHRERDLARLLLTASLPLGWKERGCKK